LIFVIIKETLQPKPQHFGNATYVSRSYDPYCFTKPEVPEVLFSHLMRRLQFLLISAHHCSSYSPENRSEHGYTSGNLLWAAYKINIIKTCTAQSQDFTPFSASLLTSSIANVS
jgi:hypothetical protein